MHNLSEALNDGDVGAITENLLTKVARVCNPRGILRQDYIRNEIETKYGEYGYGDLRSDVSEKTSAARSSSSSWRFSATSSISTRRCSRRR